MSLTDATPRLKRNRPVQITRIGRFYDPRYGDFEISAVGLDEMVRNFDRRVLGQDVFIDVAHRPENGSAGRITRLWRESDRLMAEVDWTPYGLISMEEKGFCYLSMEYAENFQDNETKTRHGWVLKGAALTIRPVIKRLEKVALSELDAVRTALAGVGINESAQSCLVENYIALAEILPSESARMEIAARIVMMAEAMPKAPPPPARLSAREVAEIAARWTREIEKERRERRERRQDRIEAFFAESERRWSGCNGPVLDALRRLAEERFNANVSEAEFDRLMADLSDERLRMASAVTMRRLASGKNAPDNPRYRSGW